MSLIEVTENRAKEEAISTAEIYGSMKYLKELMYKAHNIKTHPELDIAVSEVKAFIYSKKYLADRFEFACKDWEDFIKSYRAKRIMILFCNLAKIIDIDYDLNKSTFISGSSPIWDVFSWLRPFSNKTILDKDGKIDFDFSIYSWAICFCQGLFNDEEFNAYYDEKKLNVIRDNFYKLNEGLVCLDFYLLKNELIYFFSDQSLVSYTINIINVCIELIEFLYLELGIDRGEDFPGIYNYQLEHNNKNTSPKELNVSLEDIRFTPAELEAIETASRTTNQRKTAEELNKSLVTIQKQLQSARKKAEKKLGYKISTRELTRLLK